MDDINLNYYSIDKSTFRNIDLKSNKIDTLIISGGAFAVFYYVGLIRYLIEIDELKNINNIYSVSAGNIIGLFVILKYTIEEIIDLVLYPPLKNILNVESKDIFNVFDRLGMGDGDIGNNITKYILEKKKC